MLDEIRNILFQDHVVPGEAADIANRIFRNLESKRIRGEFL